MINKQAHNMPVRTIEIVNPSTDTWEILGENAGYFGDNGGDPDGPSWLPSIPLDEGDEGVEELFENEGQMVLVRYYEGFDEIGQAFKARGHTSPSALAEDAEVTDEDVTSALELLGKKWAYYSGEEILVIQADW